MGDTLHLTVPVPAELLAATGDAAAEAVDAVAAAAAEAARYAMHAKLGLELPE